MEDYKKKYEQRLEKAKEEIKKCGYNKGRIRMIENIFPELKESEDEKTRKALKSFFDSEISDYGNVEWRNGIRYGEIVAWLEKQGKQESITFNNAHIIDSALNDYCCEIYNALHKENGGVLSFARLQHLAMDIYGWCRGQIEQKPTEIPMTLDEAIAHCKEKSCGNSSCASQHQQLAQWLTELKEYKEQKPAWSEEDEENRILIRDIIWESVGKEIETTQCDCIVTQGEATRLMQWLKSLRPQPKSGWSEEDERICQCLIEDQEKALNDVKNDKYGHSEIISDLKEKYRNRIGWLKSLKQRMKGE